MNKNKRKPKTLPAKQEAALLALLESQTITEAARSVGVSRTSLWTWTKDRAFRDRLTAARAELFHEGMSSLKGLMSKAAAILGRLLDSKNENTRRLAAAAILGLGLKVNETLDIEERLARLEKMAEENRSKTGRYNF